MKHWWFFAGALTFIIIVLVNAPSSIHADAPPHVTGDLYAAPQTPAEGTICCTFESNGVTRTCAAAPGRACSDVCMAVCDAAT